MPFISGIGPLELIIVLVIALIVVGPGRLPDVGAALGKSIKEFRKAATDVKEATSLETITPTPVVPAPAIAATPIAPPADVAPPAPVAEAAAVAVAASDISELPEPVAADERPTPSA